MRGISEKIMPDYVTTTIFVNKVTIVDSYEGLRMMFESTDFYRLGQPTPPEPSARLSRTAVKHAML